VFHKSPSETLQIPEEAYAKVAMKKIQVYEWHKRFHDGSASDDGIPCRGRPSLSKNDENIERVSNIV
jgi:hypothetical protein